MVKIIVAQRHFENTAGIQVAVAQLNPTRAKQIIFVNDPEDVLRNVQPKEPTLIVSGNVFDDGSHGTSLARKVKRVNPQANFFIYSAMPERNEAVDGIIPKEWGTLVSGEHSLLAKILVSKEEDLSTSRLKRLFPQIT